MSRAAEVLGRPRHSDVAVHCGDCLDVMRGLESESVDAIVTDPPAGINFMNKAFDSDRGGRTKWIDWLAERMTEAKRVLKPGHMAFVWALPRTSHWTATALEDAGFEIRDIVTHVQGQGFPKSKALLKPSSEHWILCRKPGPLLPLRIDECRVGLIGEAPPTGSGDMRGRSTYAQDAWTQTQMANGGNVTPAAGRWPANFILSHAPGCQQVGTKRVKGTNPPGPGLREFAGWDAKAGPDGKPIQNYAGPDGTEEVAAWTCAPGCAVALLDQQSGARRSAGKYHKGARPQGLKAGPASIPIDGLTSSSYDDTGTASRFFHCLEADPFVFCALCDLPLDGAGVSFSVGGREATCSTSSAEHAESSSVTSLGTGGSTVPLSALDEPQRRIVLAAKSAGSLCDSCAIGIARSLAAMLRAPGQASLHGLDSITEPRRQILSRSLVMSAALLGSTGTIPTTASLSAWCGSVIDAIRTTTIRESSEEPGRFGQIDPLIYRSKASRADRGDGNKHPTVKSVALMRHLVRLITPPGGQVLDPFCGSGSTGVACVAEGLNFVGIEVDVEYAEIARGRLGLATTSDEPGDLQGEDVPVVVMRVGGRWR